MSLSTKMKQDLIEFLQGEMTLEVEEGGFTDPNARTIILSIGSEKIASCSIDIKQRREYEG
jgi:hypothetical protein